MLRWTARGKAREIPMKWYGEYLWRATVERPQGPAAEYQVCATDAAGNRACSLPVVP